MSTPANPAGPGKIVARAAGLHIDPLCNTFLNDCFKQFGIQLVPLTGNAEASFQRQKFEACLLRLYDPDAEKILSAIRKSNSNRGMVVYGLARNAMEGLRHSSYGINAVLDEPLERSNVVRVVRATRLLVMSELRRYVRVPVVSEALLESSAGRAPVTTLEVSSGGLSLRSRWLLPTNQPVKLGLELPGQSSVNLRAFICWGRAADKTYGLRFDTADERRLKVRSWIDEYLETA
jgi:PilZ domain